MSGSTVAPQSVYLSMLLHRLFEAQAARRPDHPAIECNGVTLTYRELDRRANAFAHYVRGRGLGPDGLVALHLAKSTDLFAALLGTLKAGAGYVPIDPKFPAERINSIVEDGNIPLIFTQSSMAQASSASGAHALLVDRDRSEIDALPVTPPPETEIGVEPHHTAYVIYTSGSTGRPKGVVIEHRNAVCFAASLPTTYGITEDDRVYQGFSTAFDAAVEEVWAAFALGGTLVVPTDELTRSPQDVAAFIADSRISYFSTVPSFLAMITDALPSVRILVLGGEALPAELVTRFAAGRTMFNTYGPTEATVVATMCRVQPGETVTIGVALPGYETFVLDDQMRQVVPGREGELYIGGGAIARGYMNRPDLTAEKFVPNPFGTSPRLYRTHDLVRPREDGAIEFLGRIDGQIKIRGFRVELSEIEAVLMEVPGVRNAAVAAIEKGGLKELAAYVVMDNPGSEIDRVAAVQHMRAKMPEYMVPKYLDHIEELPRMVSGKVDRKSLPPPVNVLSASAARTFVAPRTEIERLVVEAWAQSLGNTHISVTDDFFLDLGGHSLVAAQAVTAMRQKLGHEQVSVRDIYALRTAEKLSGHLANVRVVKFKEQDGPLVTPSERVFHSVPRSERIACIALQVLSLAVFYAAVGMPIAVVTYAIMGVLGEGNVNVQGIVRTLVIAGFLVWPTYLLLGIGAKWLIVGRFRPGKIPLWSIAYWRFWTVRLFVGLSGATFFRGTPLMNLYLRVMGAKVGRGALMSTVHCFAFDLVSIGKGASVGAETQMLGYSVRDGMLMIGSIDIGEDCFVGMHCVLGLDVTMQPGSRLDDVSLLADGDRIAAGEGRRGVPAEPAEVPLPEREGGKPTPNRPIVFGLWHAALIYVIGYVAIFSSVPSVHLVAWAMSQGIVWGILATFLAIPLAILVYATLVLGIKRFFGREKGGVFPLHSHEYLIHWTFDKLLAGLNNVLMPIYATLYAAPMLRLFGAKVGPSAEVSTVQHISPDLLEIGGGSFLADACLVGGSRIHRGLVQIRPNRIGSRTFIGNSAVVPGGVDIGDDCLIGVQSVPPAGVSQVQSGTRWLGAPGFELPSTQKVEGFSDEQTYKPTRKMYWTRASIDALRILLPIQLSAAALIGYVGLLYLARMHLPLWAAVMMVPLWCMLLSWAAVMMAAGIKDILVGAYQPLVKPLWSKFVWLNEVVNGVFESTATPVIKPLLGTPFAVWGLRLMGCRIGRHVYMDTTLYSEFDLATIGDFAAVNFGATIQTHLFEDRIMKMGRLEIGTGASVSNMGIVLYDTKMMPGSHLASLSVLMKGETLPPLTAWYGIPTQPMPERPRKIAEATPPAAGAVELQPSAA